MGLEVKSRNWWLNEGRKRERIRILRVLTKIINAEQYGKQRHFLGEVKAIIAGRDRRKD